MPTDLGARTPSLPAEILYSVHNFLNVILYYFIIKEYHEIMKTNIWHTFIPVFTLCGIFFSKSQDVRETAIIN
jgi:hypothetical protein